MEKKILIKYLFIYFYLYIRTIHIGVHICLSLSFLLSLVDDEEAPVHLCGQRVTCPDESFSDFGFVTTTKPVDLHVSTCHTLESYYIQMHPDKKECLIQILVT